MRQKRKRQRVRERQRIKECSKARNPHCDLERSKSPENQLLEDRIEKKNESKTERCGDKKRLKIKGI